MILYKKLLLHLRNLRFWARRDPIRDPEGVSTYEKQPSVCANLRCSYMYVCQNSFVLLADWLFDDVILFILFELRLTDT